MVWRIWSRKVTGCWLRLRKRGDPGLCDTGSQRDEFEERPRVKERVGSESAFDAACPDDQFVINALQLEDGWVMLAAGQGICQASENPNWPVPMNVELGSIQIAERLERTIWLGFESVPLMRLSTMFLPTDRQASSKGILKRGTLGRLRSNSTRERS